MFLLTITLAKEIIMITFTTEEEDLSKDPNFFHTNKKNIVNIVGDGEKNTT